MTTQHNITHNRDYPPQSLHLSPENGRRFIKFHYELETFLEVPLNKSQVICWLLDNAEREIASLNEDE